MSTEPVTGLTEWEAGQTQPHVPVNAQLRALAILGRGVVATIATADPGSPAEGDSHLVGVGTGAFAGKDGQIAYYSGGWKFLVPQFGWEVVLLSDGSRLRWTDLTTDAWLIVSPSVSAGRGDAAAPLVAGVDATTQRWSTPLTADRAVTLSTTGAKIGDRFRIVRGAAATGAFNLNVGTGPLKALASAGTWCDVEFDGSAWFLSAYGSL